MFTPFLLLLQLTVDVMDLLAVVEHVGLSRHWVRLLSFSFICIVGVILTTH